MAAAKEIHRLHQTAAPRHCDVHDRLGNASRIPPDLFPWLHGFFIAVHIQDMSTYIKTYTDIQYVYIYKYMEIYGLGSFVCVHISNTKKR